MLTAGYFNFTTTKNMGSMTESKNRQRCIKDSGFLPSSLVMMEQVQGAEIIFISNTDKRDKCVSGADGLVVDKTDNVDVILGVLTADCIPLFGVNRKTGSYGIFHAGWRGINSGIVEKAVESLGKPVTDLFFAIGPHICGDCYKVGADFEKIFAAGYKNGNLSLRDEVLSRLTKSGLKPEKVDCVSLKNFCTAHNPALFYSHRRGEKNKRMLSVITKIPLFGKEGLGEIFQ
ncbi:MAG: polyphenol oxidase family protein [Elusimicrobiota bacterium]